MNNIITNIDVLKYFIDNYGINKIISRELNGKIQEIDRLNYIEELKKYLDTEVSNDIESIKNKMKIKEDKLKGIKIKQLEAEKKQDIKNTSALAKLREIILQEYEKKYKQKHDDEMKKN